MDTEKEINSIKQSIREIEEDLTNLKQQLCLNKMIRPEDFLTDTEKADILNKRKYMCLICSKVKEPKYFNEYNEETGKGICEECANTDFPGNDLDF